MSPPNKSECFCASVRVRVDIDIFPAIPQPNQNVCVFECVERAKNTPASMYARAHTQTQTQNTHTHTHAHSLVQPSVVMSYSICFCLTHARTHTARRTHAHTAQRPAVVRLCRRHHGGCSHWQGTQFTCFTSWRCTQFTCFS